MSTEQSNEVQEVEDQEKPAKKRKQIFQRAVKRDYQRQNFSQKTR